MAHTLFKARMRTYNAFTAVLCNVMTISEQHVHVQCVIITQIYRRTSLAMRFDPIRLVAKLWLSHAAVKQRVTRMVRVRTVVDGAVAIGRVRQRKLLVDTHTHTTSRES